MGMPKRFVVFGVGFFRVSSQNKQTLSKGDISRKLVNFNCRKDIMPHEI